MGSKIVFSLVDQGSSEDYFSILQSFFHPHLVGSDYDPATKLSEILYRKFCPLNFCQLPRI